MEFQKSAGVCDPGQYKSNIPVDLEKSLLVRLEALGRRICSNFHMKRLQLHHKLLS